MKEDEEQPMDPALRKRKNDDGPNEVNASSQIDQQEKRPKTEPNDDHDSGNENNVTGAATTTSDHPAGAQEASSESHAPPPPQTPTQPAPFPFVGYFPPFFGYPQAPVYGHPPMMQTTPSKNDDSSKSRSKRNEDEDPSNTALGGSDEPKELTNGTETSQVVTSPNYCKPQPPGPYPHGFPPHMPPFVIPYGRSPIPHPQNIPTPFPPAPNANNMLMAMMMMSARMPASQGTLLYMQCDLDQLSDYQTLVRQQLELFEAGPGDIESNTQGRKKPVVLGQVGLRCRHCSSLPVRSRGRGAVYYPGKLLGVYQAAQNMASSHLIQACRHIPASIRDELKRLRERKDNACGGKTYWADGCKAVGVVERADGLFFHSGQSVRELSTAQSTDHLEVGPQEDALLEQGENADV